MATCAVYSFSGFTAEPERHLCLHHDGYPTGAAWRFAAAARAGASPAEFLQCFLATNPTAEPLLAPEQSLAAEYRYRVELNGSRCLRLLVHCWRRYPGDIGWQRRCGPMPLERFVARFLPGG
jgi:hypothetical protein